MPHIRHKRRPRPHYSINVVLGLVVLLLFGVTGSKVINFSHAASANPYGYADYCALENNETVIYGWAADPNAGSLSDPSVTINAGGQAVTVPTNRSGYRDAAVNAWIDQNRTGDPKPGTYGFRAPLPGLFKGAHDIITGTVLNVGPGSSVILNINNSSYTDGDANKPFFANDMIPDACLANPPTSPTPTPTTTPTPTGTPAPTQVSTSVHNDDVDTTVTAGTLAASAAVSSDGATSLHLNYGTSPIKLDQSTSDQQASGDTVTVPVTGLAPSTTYSFQVVRTYPDGKTSTSSIQTFSTLGYVVAVHFVDNHNQGIQGIQTVISSDVKKTKTSDDQGTVQFANLHEGSYSVSYLYHNAKYSRPVTVNATMVGPDAADAPHVVTLNFTINIENIAAAPTKASSNGANPLVIVVAVVLGLAAMILLAFFWLRRSKQRREEEWYNRPPLPAPGVPSAAPGRTAPQQPQALPVNPAASFAEKPTPHAGESLKDMVLRSMAEEAKRKNQNK